MPFRYARVLAATLIGLSAASAPAQVVAVVGNTTTQQVGDALTVDLGTVSTNIDVFIYDSQPDANTGLPLHSIGQIIFNGTVASGTAPVVRILVAKQASQFPSLPTSRLDEGLVNLGTAANNSGGIAFTDTALRDASVLALSVSGDIHGNIGVGRVFRIQATNAQANNKITASIHAYAGNAAASPTLGQMSIGVITAYDGITGDITAGQATDTERLNIASIGRITAVGPATSSVSNNP